MVIRVSGLFVLAFFVVLAAFAMARSPEAGHIAPAVGAPTDAAPAEEDARATAVPLVSIGAGERLTASAPVAKDEPSVPPYPPPPTPTLPPVSRQLVLPSATPVAPAESTAAPASSASRAIETTPQRPRQALQAPSPTPRNASRPSPTPAPLGATPAIATSDSTSGQALRCEVDPDSPLTDDERSALHNVCPSGSPVVCGTSLAARINETPAGATLNLTGCTYSSNAITINKAITIIGPTVTFPTANPWGDGIWLAANNITLDGWTFLSAGLPVGMTSVQNARILNSKFQGYSGGPIGMWGEVRHVLIEGNVFANTRNVQSGFVGGRGSEGTNPCAQVGRYVTIRGNTGDQNTNGWFGIELKCFEDVVIERNSLKGGQVLISLPDSNRVTIRDNNLDLRGTPYWGVELAKAHDVRLENNTVQGDGPTSGDDAFSANSGSLRATVYRNMAARLRTLYAGPLEADIRWNCLENVAFVTQFGSPQTSTISENGAC